MFGWTCQLTHGDRQAGVTGNRFNLRVRGAAETEKEVDVEAILKDLQSKVIFASRELAEQHVSVFGRGMKCSGVRTRSGTPSKTKPP